MIAYVHTNNAGSVGTRVLLLFQDSDLGRPCNTPSELARFRLGYHGFSTTE